MKRDFQTQRQLRGLVNKSTRLTGVQTETYILLSTHQGLKVKHRSAVFPAPSVSPDPNGDTRRFCKNHINMISYSFCSVPLLVFGAATAGLIRLTPSAAHD